MVYTFALDKAMLVGFLVAIAGLAFAGKFKEMNPYLLLSVGLLLVGAVFSA